MELNYKTFKEIVNRAEIFLPYSFLLRELIAAKKIKKLSRFSLSDSTILEYTGASFVDDLKAIKKDYYVVSSFNFATVRDMEEYISLI